MAPLSKYLLGVVIALIAGSACYNTSVFKRLDHTAAMQELEHSLREEQRKVQELQEEILRMKRSNRKSVINAPPPMKNSTTSLIDEYFPSVLHPIYKYSKNYIPKFNVTRSMLRQSRPVVGNTQRLHAYIRKLQSKQCTTVLVLGGSITDGRRVVDGFQGAYPLKFALWLSKVYPCVEPDGRPGMHELKTTRASNSQMQFTSRSIIEGIDCFDLVILEYNVNDYFIADLPHALEDKGTYGKLREYASLWYFEALLRRLLLLRKPDPPAIITFNAGYFGRSWEGHPSYYKEKARTNSLFRNNEEPSKIWLSSLYGIPVFSASIWLLPLAGKMGSKYQFSAKYPYSTIQWHADECCHPDQQGHSILTLVLAYNIVEEEKMMNWLHHNEADFDVDKDPTTYTTPILRNPVYLSLEEDEMYVRGDTDSSSGVDFTDPDGEDSFRDRIVANEGWSWRCDDKGKCGFEADGTDRGQHIAIPLNGTEHGIVELQYIVSYENFGLSEAWLGEETKEQVDLWCNKTVEHPFMRREARQRPHHLIAHWEETASVPKVDLLEERLYEGESKALHICLTPKNPHTAGKKNKFKLLGVRVY